MPEPLNTIWNLLLILIGFGLVIFIHELGHFVAARWAGIRVPAFAVGFGPAVCSWRRGLGLRRGSTEPEYLRRLEAAGQRLDTGRIDGVGETEYRLNYFPFGGYVRMLGQEDANPQATSEAPDSYTSKPVWKRMVVVSAGVVMNILLAAVLFVVVFLIGLGEPPAVVGDVEPGSPAAVAGLEPGDEITSINGRRTNTFLDITLAAAMSGPEETLETIVQRPGVEEPMRFAVTPRFSESLRMKAIGVSWASSTELIRPGRGVDEAELIAQLDRAGLTGVRPGMRLVAIDGAPVEETPVWRGRRVALLTPLRTALLEAAGGPVEATFEDGDGTRATTTLRARPKHQTSEAMLGGEKRGFSHLLGLTPPMLVAAVQRKGEDAGLRAGDVFARIGDVEWPNVIDGIAEVRAHRGTDVELVVVRDGAIVTLTAPVSEAGTIGFFPDEAFSTPFVTAATDVESPLAAARFVPAIAPGTRLIAVGDEPVSDYASLRGALRAATADAHALGEGASVELSLALLQPGSLESADVERRAWNLSPDDVAALHDLGWRTDHIARQFMQAELLMRASGPLDAMVMGVKKTHRFMMLTYLTFKRLWQGTVKVDQLKGPVGIAHIGSQVAERGMVYLLFFLGLISVNLAVINFLPIPVVDGGLFVLLVAEGITRRPVPLVVQNVATMIGLALILSIFVVVTINDIRALLF